MAFQYKQRAEATVEQRASQQGGTFDGFIKDEYRTYGPKGGDNAIRVLPRDAGEGADHYGEDVWVHYGVGPDRASVICPTKMANEACPLCEERMRAEKRGDEEATKDLKASRRVIVWLIDRKNEEQGPMLWAMPWTVDRDISKVCKDRETGQYYFVEDPEKGYDVYFDRSGTPPYVEYTGYQLSRRPNSVDPKHLDYVSANPLLDVLRIRNYDEIKKLFDGIKAAEPAVEAAAAVAPQKEIAQEARPPAQEQKEPERQEAPPPPEVKAQAATPPPSSSPAPTGAERAAALRARFAANKEKEKTT